MAGVEEEGELAALREALRQQARAVEELRAELEEERQAAASGADEALAMILRLQAEKSTERMEAEQFRRVAEERIQHDEDTLAFLKALVFHQEMEISSLNRRLLAVQATGDDPFSPATALDLPWLRKLAKNGVASRRNASLPAAHLEELCSELDVAVGTDDAAAYRKRSGGDRRPARTVSDIGEVIGREDRARHNQSEPPKAVPVGLPPSPACAELPRAKRRALSGQNLAEIIAEEEEKSCKSNTAVEADIEQIKATVQSLQTELTKLRKSTLSVGNAQSRLLTEICSKLDGAMPRQQSLQGSHGSSPVLLTAAIREASSSSKGQSYEPQSELLMNNFIEVCGLTFAATIVRPLIKVAASMSLLRCVLILILAVAVRKVLMNS